MDYSHNLIMCHLLILTTVAPPNTADIGTDEKASVFGNGRYCESYIPYKTLIGNWKWAAVLGEAVLGRAVLGGGGETVFRF